MVSSSRLPSTRQYTYWEFRSGWTKFVSDEVLDTRYFNGPVFATSGSPYYSRFAVGDRLALSDPTRFYSPRRIELGVTVGTP